jgi:DNA-binding NtrC family response regulator
MNPEHNNKEPVDHSTPDRVPIILVVEDDVMVRMGIADHLRSNGYVVLEAASFDEARVLFAVGWLIEAVFSDVKLPDLRDGIELALWIELNHPDVPVLLTSAYDGAVRAAALSCGNVHEFLSKPYDFRKVEELLRQVLDA